MMIQMMMEVLVMIWAAALPLLFSGKSDAVAVVAVDGGGNKHRGWEQ